MKKSKLKMATELSLLSVGLTFISPSEIFASQQMPSSDNYSVSDLNTWSPEQIATFLKSSTDEKVSDATPEVPTIAFQKAQKFITVQNNKFILNIPPSSGLSSAEIQQAQVSVNRSNENILKNNGVINPSDLSITYQNDTANIQLRSSAGDTSVKWFWWGGRQYFWSNAAVENVAYKYDHYSVTLGATGIIGTLMTAGISAAVGGAGSLYFTNLASSLRHYNSMHSKSKIYQNMTWVGTYNFGTY